MARQVKKQSRQEAHMYFDDAEGRTEVQVTETGALIEQTDKATGVTDVIKLPLHICNALRKRFSS